MTNKEVLTEVESLIMMTLWDHEEDITFQTMMKEIRERGGRDYKDPNIRPVILRLEYKGFLESHKENGQVILHPLVSRAQYGARVAKRDADAWFAGSVSNMIASLRDSRQISEEEWEKIRELLQ
ncbi:MAG: BlaI/MecI/CopY family transcriptional regulator [Lachnospiraceae bacterium]|nr:BlaI/MecI/CopY family transcriptional regulator [Lachnospiraceae bacterium]